MSFHRLLAFVRKDIRVFIVDRQAVALSLLVPIMIASILGWMDAKSSDSEPTHPVEINFVDLDRSDLSKAILDRLSRGGVVQPIASDQKTATQNVKEGKIAAAIVLPRGFNRIVSSEFSGGIKPEFQLISDPSKVIQAQIVKGAMLEEASSAIANQSFGMFGDVGGVPLKVDEIRASAGTSAKWAPAAHDYAGFGMQGLLFFAMEAAVGLVRERRLGIWQRLIAAPIPASFFLLSREISSIIVALSIVGALSLIGALLFGIRILGSPFGFVAMAVSSAVVAATFGLLIATLGKTESQSRGIAFLLIMVMLATGGAWFPMEKMPPFIQTLADFLPVKWTVNGFDGVTWRALPLSDTLIDSGALLGFAVVFGVIAIIRFRASSFVAN